jgi:transposase
MSPRRRKTYRPYEPNQSLLLPPSLRDWLPENHLAFFVSDVIDEIDLRPILSKYEREGRGYPPYDPRMMVKVLVYAYCVGVASSRKIAQRLQEDVAFRLLAANNWPDFRTISDFRKRHLRELSGLFDQVLHMCAKSGLVKLGHVALDGTKIEANASKHKAMSYGRMKKEDDRIAAEVKRMLEEAERIDAEEDERFGKDKRGDELPEELSRRESRRKKIREAKEALEREAREKDKAKIEEEERKKKDGEPLRKRKYPLGVPREKAQYNFTDPESQIMLNGRREFVQAYNAQIAVDANAQVIVAAEVSNVAPDQAHGVWMTDRIVKTAGRPTVMTMDAGYFSAATAKHMEKQRIDAYIALQRSRHDARPSPPLRALTSRTAPWWDRMRRKLATKRGARIYALRKAIVEPVIGQIKAARGFRRFLLRGLENVKAEWRLICATNNLLKLFRAAHA